MKYTVANCKKLKKIISENPHLKMKEIAEIFGDRYEYVIALASYFKISYLKTRNDAIIKDYILGKTIKEVSIKYNLSISAIYRILDKNNIPRRVRIKKFSPKNKIFLDKLKKCNFSIKKIADLYNVDETTIRKYIKKHSLENLIKENNVRSKSRGLNIKMNIFKYLDENPYIVNSNKKQKSKLYDLLVLKFGGNREYVRKVVNKWLKEKQWEEKNRQKNKE